MRELLIKIKLVAMYLRLAKRMLLEADKRLLWKLFWNMGVRGLRSVWLHQRRLKRGEFQFTFNRAFAQVVEGCAAPRELDDDCWLTLAMQNAYVNLHELGHAHSVEVWQAGRLVGGVGHAKGLRQRR